MGERVALNFTQRMCGISTATRRYVAAVPEGCRHADHRHPEDDARPSPARALRRSSGRRSQPSQRSRLGGPDQGQPHRRGRRRSRGDRGARARALPTRAGSSARSTRSISSKRRSPRARTSCCSTTWIRRPSKRRFGGRVVVRCSRRRAASRSSASPELARAGRGRDQRRRAHALDARPRTSASTSSDDRDRRASPDLARAARRHRVARCARWASPLVIADETDVDERRREARSARRRAARRGVARRESQTSGRGRQGRAWLSPRGENLLFSVLLRLRCAPARVPPVSLACGLAVRDAVARALGAAAADDGRGVL